MNKEKKAQRSARGDPPGGALLSAENNVIGMSLNDRENFRRAWAIGVRICHFAEPTNRVLWSAVRYGVTETLDAGYPALIERLKEECPLTQNVEFYAAPLVVAWLERRFRAEMEMALKHFPPDAKTVARLLVNLEERMTKLRMWEGYRDETGRQSGVISSPRKRHKQKREIQSDESSERDLQAAFDHLHN